MRILVFGGLAVSLLACKTSDETMMAAPGTSSAMGTSGAMGSAMTPMQDNPNMARGAASPDPKRPPLPLDDDELALRYQKCIGFANAASWDDFKTCYAPDAKFEQPGLGEAHGLGEEIGERKNARIAFPDERNEPLLVMVNGHTIIAISKITATNTQSLSGPTGTVVATNKRAGILLGHVVTVDDSGRGIRDAAYFDVQTIVAQMGSSKLPARTADLPARPIEVVTTFGDQTERTNLAAVTTFVTAYHQHDAKALAAILADNIVWSEQPLDKDLDKQALLANATALWKGFSDLKLTVTTSWAAGSYVAAIQTLAGTNVGDIASLGIKKTGKKLALPLLGIYKLQDGKISAVWWFWQRSSLAKQLAAK